MPLADYYENVVGVKMGNTEIETTCKTPSCSYFSDSGGGGAPAV